MAVHHPATIVPTKLELLQAWVPQQPWVGAADASSLTRVGSYRFDDPDGEVGMETHLLGTADGQVLQVPLTYRGVPLPGADEALVTTMTHSTLGRRWVYDACYDRVYVTALAATILTGGREADLFAATDAGLVQEETTTFVRGSGTATADQMPDVDAVVTHAGTVTSLRAGGVRVCLRRLLHDAPDTPPAGLTLVGTWPGRRAPQLLATLERE